MDGADVAWGLGCVGITKITEAARRVGAMKQPRCFIASIEQKIVSKKIRFQRFRAPKIQGVGTVWLWPCGRSRPG